MVQTWKFVTIKKWSVCMGHKCISSYYNLMACGINENSDLFLVSRVEASLSGTSSLDMDAFC